MTIELRLPDMGEGIDDVTINRWLKQEGDTVSEGEVILEVATDKIDTDVAASASGTLLKRNFGEGELVAVDAVLAYIGEAGESIPESDATPDKESQAVASDAATPDTNDAEATTTAESVKITPVAERMMSEHGIQPGDVPGGADGKITKQDVQEFMDQDQAESADAPPALPDELANIPSYVVQRTAAENSIDLDEIADGRPLSTLTKYDVLSAAASRAAGKAVTVSPHYPKPQGNIQANAQVNTQSSAPQVAQPKGAAVSSPSMPAEVLIQPTRMRQLIARNTHESLQNSPQLTTWHDVDMTAVLLHRKANKKIFAAEKINLTVTAYLVAATVAGLKAVPAANAKWTDEGILIKRNYHVGMAAALPMDEYGLGGLIVPVIRDAGDLNLQGIARQVNQLGDKARSNELTGADLQGGTFTLTNYGTSGSRFQTPIIHDNQAGILGTGAVEKRPVVVSNGHPLEANMGDHLVFKPMLTLALTFDHRVLDGASADAFCVAMKSALEGWA